MEFIVATVLVSAVSYGAHWVALALFPDYRARYRA